jgi:glycosyltransferase involved in cell wall biosynthesis
MRISVVIPTFNRAQLLPRALDSVFAQTAAAQEVIVIDDGSIDDTEAMIRSRYPTVRYYRQPHAGVSAARNHGFALAHCDWLALLDSDDVWHPDKLAAQSALAEHVPHLRLIHCDELWFRNGKPCRQRAHQRKFGGWIFEHCLTGCAIAPSAVLLHRTVLQDHGNFDESLEACEDYDLWLRIRVLTSLLARHTLDARQSAATRKVLQQQFDIFITGARKRGHIDEANFHESLRCNLHL